MNLNNNISEKNIFDFVFFPERLSEEKAEVIKSSGKFQNEIEFYNEMKKSISNEIPAELKLKIAEKIPAYKPVSIYKLHSVENPKRKHINGLVLAAASENNAKPKVTSKTFYDDNKTFIIKVLNYENSAKIFVFSTQEEVIKNFDILITPQNVRYHLNDNTVPLELDHNVDPENVIIEFNLTKHN